MRKKKPKKRVYKNSTHPLHMKKDIMEKKIPFNASVRRKVVLEFKNVCGELGLGISPMTEELILQFVIDYRKSQRLDGNIVFK